MINFATYSFNSFLLPAQLMNPDLRLFLSEIVTKLLWLDCLIMNGYIGGMVVSNIKKEARFLLPVLYHSFL